MDTQRFGFKYFQGRGRSTGSPIVIQLSGGLVIGRSLRHHFMLRAPQSIV